MEDNLSPHANIGVRAFLFTPINSHAYNSQMTESAENQVTELCKAMKIPTPVEFLTHAMAGTDPRRVSLVYLKIMALEEEYGESPPDEWDWADLVDLIKAEYRGSIIEIGKSQDAAKQLMEYMYPKRKAVENTNITQIVESRPLSKQEVKDLRKEFDLDY